MIIHPIIYMMKLILTVGCPSYDDGNYIPRNQGNNVNVERQWPSQMEPCDYISLITTFWQLMATFTGKYLLWKHGKRVYSNLINRRKSRSWRMIREFGTLSTNFLTHTRRHRQHTRPYCSDNAGRGGENRGLVMCKPANLTWQETVQKTNI